MIKYIKFRYFRRFIGEFELPYEVLVDFGSKLLREGVVCDLPLGQAADVGIVQMTIRSEIGDVGEILIFLRVERRF